MTFPIALSGLNAASKQLDITANNIANVNTSGFKSARAEFSDVFATASNDISSKKGGSGVQLAAVTQQFSQGNVDFTNNNLDMAISGEGFFVMKGPEGQVYSRNGAFSVDRDGYVVNSALQRLQVFPTVAGGGFATGALGDLQLQTTESPPRASTTGAIGVNLPGNASAPALAFDPSIPSSYNNSTSTTVYDSLGNAHTATYYFAKTATANTWDQYLYVDGQAVGGANTMAFGTDGTLLTPASGSITYPPHDPANGAAPISLSFDFSATTQYGSQFGVNSLSQDGYSTGRMTGIALDKSGVVSARFTNGQLKQLGKLAIAVFSNPNGLAQQGNTSWAETFSSGTPRLGEAGTSSFGLVQAGALESSNVDLTAQLVQMITAQRNFQANAQMISTANQVTQTIINMRG